ncbi:MAG: SMP-30/gluconolactonase/LRE family protein, partial [Acidobacteriaceae bacterium]|nr:SMP-30/gluconolactonase/LRE family protein [Acidobacteriaceae bacterium]
SACPRNFMPSNERVFGQESGSGDGMRVDQSGNLYVTGPKSIWVWDLQGNHIGTIELPEQPANLAWGGKGYSTLYIMVTHSVYSLPTKAHGFVPYPR